MTYKSIYDIRICDTIYIITQKKGVYNVEAKQISRIDITGECLPDITAEIYAKGNTGTISISIKDREAGKLRTSRASAQEWCSFMNKTNNTKGDCSGK
jgi:hypothetical protein